MTWCYEFNPRLSQLFLPAYFRLSPLQKHVRKVVGGFGKKSCVSNDVRKPGNICVSDRHDMTLAVKVALNPNATKQPTSEPNFSSFLALYQQQILGRKFSKRVKNSMGKREIAVKNNFSFSTVISKIHKTRVCLEKGLFHFIFISKYNLSCSYLPIVNANRKPHFILWRPSKKSCFSQTTNFRRFQTEWFADDNFNFDEIGRVLQYL